MQQFSGSRFINSHLIEVLVRYREVSWANKLSLHHSQLGSSYNGCEFVVSHVNGSFEAASIASAELRWLAIGAVKQGISGSDTGIRRRFFVQHEEAISRNVSLHGWET